jgi:hypothetical protein
MRTTIDVARDLTAIVDMSEALEDQAINDANDHLMPGGLAMVAQGPVANLEAWAHKLDAAERLGIHPAIEDDDEWEPPLQSLLFWSEDLRRIHDQEFEPAPHRPRPTEATEANIIRHHLDWLWENEPKWDDFAQHIADARARMEALPSAAFRACRSTARAASSSSPLPTDASTDGATVTTASAQSRTSDAPTTAAACATSGSAASAIGATAWRTTPGPWLNRRS